MKYEHIPKHKCMNSGPDLPMLLALHPVYKDLSRMSAPLVGSIFPASISMSRT